MKKKGLENKTLFSMYKIDAIGIQESDINDIINIIQNNHKIQKVILFGSRAKGTFNNGSDIDLALDGSGLTLTEILDIFNKLESLYLPYKFDWSQNVSSSYAL